MIKDSGQRLIKKRTVVLLIIAITGVISLGTFLIIKDTKQSILSKTHNDIRTIAQLKNEQIAGWQKERMNYPKVFIDSPFFIEGIEKWLSSRNNLKFKSDILKRLELMNPNNIYENIFIASPEGESFVTLNPLPSKLDSVTVSFVKKSASERKIFCTDFYFCRTHNKIHLDYLAPFVNSKNQVIAIIVYRVDPEQYLYPLIERWPASSQTSEIVIVRKDGNASTVLNNLNKQKNAALRLRFSLSKSEIPAVKAVLGYTGLSEGIDYHGDEVVAYIEPIPQTNWFMIAKMDKSELYSGLYFEENIILIMALLIIVSAGALVIWFYLYRQKNVLRDILVKEQELRKAKEEYQSLFESMPVGIYRTTPKGEIALANKALINLLECSSFEELVKKNDEDPDFGPTYSNDEFRRILEDSDEVAGIEAYWKLGNGKLKYIRESSRVVRDSNGNSLYYEGTLEDLTERKNAEIDVTAARERAELYLDIVEVILIILDNNGIVKLVNRKGCQVLGYTEEELIGREWFKIWLPEEEYESAYGYYKNIISGQLENLEYYENNIVTKSGDKKFIAWHNNVIKDSNGNITGIISSGEDITERRKMEEALKQSEYFFKETQKAGFIGSYFCDFVKGIWDSSEVLDEIFGIDKDYFRSVPGWIDIIHPDDQEMMSKYLTEEVIGKHNKFNKEYRIIRKSDGAVRWVLGLGHVNLDKNDNAVTMIGTIQDITERKEAEDKLHKSEAKFSSIFSQMMEMAVLHKVVRDLSGNIIDYRILECNEAFTRITGITPAMAVGKLASEVYQVYPAPYLAEFSKVADTGVPYEYKTYFPPMDKHFQISVVSPEKDYFATITTDITELSRFNEMLVNKNKELENYLYVASHDLRSPLVNIQGFSSRLGKQAEVIKSVLGKCQLENEDKNLIEDILDKKLPSSLEYIYTNVTKMDFLISGLLQISRTGKVTMAIRPVNMNQLFSNILKSFDYEIAEAKAEVKLGDLSPCYGDENLLNQLFSNLISNSIKYRSAQRPCQIEIESLGKFKKVVYKIKDNGIGISPRHHDKIWNVFYRINPNEIATGEGIGLSLAKRIIDKHQGKIWVESDENAGSTFYVELSTVPFSELK